MDKEFIEQIEHLYDIDIISVQQINSILYMKNYIILFYIIFFVTVIVFWKMEKSMLSGWGSLR